MQRGLSSVDVVMVTTALNAYLICDSELIHYVAHHSYFITYRTQCGQLR